MVEENVKNQLFSHESLQKKERVVDYLNSLIEGIESGTIVFKNQGQEIHLKPSGLLSLEIRVKRKGDRNKVNFDLKWKNSNKNSEFLNC